MPYAQKINRQNKALFIFLLDQSYSMDDPLANSSNRKADELALAMNAWLYEMVEACAQSEGFKDYFDVAVIGYCSDDEGNPVIEPALIGALGGRELVSISDIAANIARMDQIDKVDVDEETGEMHVTPTERPIWIDPKTQGATPICSAIVKACEIIDGWIPNHSTSFPPIVINITDGESSEGDPLPYAETLKQRRTDDGEVLFFNCCLSSTPSDKFMFRGNGEIMPDQFARTLFQMSSILPEPMVKLARARKQELEPNARGMAYNADMVDLINFLDMGTTPASDLR